MWNNDDFSPETVEEQIERFVQVQPRQHPNAILTQELKVMCEEDQAMVERVWMCYAARLGIRPALDGQSAPSPSPSSPPKTGAFSTVPAQRQARPAHRSRRIFALMAAVLVAAVLVGSTLWVVRTLHQPGGVATHLTATPRLTQTHASTPTPTVVPPALAPSGRVNAQLVYDDATNALLLFSGQDYTGAPPLTDTWIWTGSAWTRLHPAHNPVSRTDAAIAYDPATRQVVLFGGDGITSFMDDTWTWNGGDWTQQHPANSPPARVGASLAYDAATGQLVLFGGTHTPGFNVPDLNDTWIWTGSTWVQQHPVTAPPLSATLQGQTVTFAYPSMAYNPTTGKLMLTLIGQGANDGTQADYWTQADWTWTGSNWTEGNATGPAVESSQIFYDTHLHVVFDLTSFLPRTSVDVENALWKWTGQTWAVVESW